MKVFFWSDNVRVQIFTYILSRACVKIADSNILSRASLKWIAAHMRRLCFWCEYCAPEALKKVFLRATCSKYNLRASRQYMAAKITHNWELIFCVLSFANRVIHVKNCKNNKFMCARVHLLSPYMRIILVSVRQSAKPHNWIIFEKYSTYIIQ